MSYQIAKQITFEETCGVLEADVLRISRDSNGWNISDKLQLFWEIAHCGKRLISVFLDFFASIDKISF